MRRDSKWKHQNGLIMLFATKISIARIWKLSCLPATVLYSQRIWETGLPMEAAYPPNLTQLSPMIKEEDYKLWTGISKATGQIKRNKEMSIRSSKLLTLPSSRLTSRTPSPEKTELHLQRFQTCRLHQAEEAKLYTPNTKSLNFTIIRQDFNIVII